MKEKIRNRVGELQSEYKKGQERMAILEQEMDSLKTSMLRISGAIQVLEELFNENEDIPFLTKGSSNGKLE